MFKTKMMITMLLIALTTGLFATTINIPTDYSTIQAGLNAASEGDAVLVAADTYYENITWPATNGIKLFGSGEEDCIIDGNQQASVIRFEEELDGIIDTTTLISDFTITNGSAYAGGGIYCYSSSPSLVDVTISGNSASKGGGIYCWGSSPSFSSENRCNIYSNNVQSRGSGADIFAYNCPVIDVIVDTFTVMIPTEYHASPLDNFTFDILNSVNPQVDADLYVSPDGDNANDGLTAETPLKTIQHATSIILADSTNSHTINLANGIYSPSTNGEYFPVEVINYVSLVGESEEGVILDADSVAGVMRCTYVTSATISHLTLTNGSASAGGGIYCYYSSPSLENVTLSNNSASAGGGIYCYYSSPSLENVTITNNSASAWGGGIYCHYSSPSLIDVTITDNSASDYGGGVYCQSSSPSLANVTISGNSAEYYGGGICCYSSSPSLVYVTITDNSASAGGGIFGSSSSPSLENVTLSNNSAYEGGGIYCGYNSSPSLVDVTITNNSAEYDGGGLYCYDYSSPSLENVTITNNSASDYGGGVYCQSYSPSLENVTLSNNSAYEGGGIYCGYNSSPSLVDVTITNNSANYGGGMYCDNSSPSLENVTITNNSAYFGGGIYCDNSSPSFSAENRCNIYFNNTTSRGSGADIYSSSTITVIVDTFTVMIPTEYHASPLDNFTFDILNTVNPQVDADLYVSPDGDNSNDGLTAGTPLKTIQYATSIILADSLNPHTIHLANGIYSPGTNGEYFPVEVINYVSLVGESEEGVILDANSVAGVMRCRYVTSSTISHLTLTNGSASTGGGMYCDNSSPSLVNVTLSNNSASYSGGGMYCDNSSPSLVDVTISANSANSYGGGIYCHYSSPSLENVTITNNSAGYDGGGIFCGDSSPSLENVTISANSANSYGGGIFCLHESSPSLANVTISNNSASYGGGIFCFWNSSPSLVNCILWNDAPQEVYFNGDYCSNSIMIAYSDIQGGEAGIVTNDNATVYWEDGNIDLDPLFVDAATGDYHLTEYSPCIDVGNPDSQYNDPDGTRSDMGAFYYDQSGNIPDIPANVTAIVAQDSVQISWDAVSGATSYKVYSSDNPYSGFALDETGTFDGESWTAAISNTKKFFYVIAVK